MKFSIAFALEVDAKALKQMNITFPKTLKDFETFGVLYFSVV